MNSLPFFSNLKLRAKLLVPFILIFSTSSVIGAVFYINAISRTLEEGRKSVLQSHAARIREHILSQEQRVLFHAQRMAEMKNLADQIVDTNQVRILQIDELQALDAENIRLIGYAGEQYPTASPLYPLVQLGLKGLRFATLVEDVAASGEIFRLAAVAPLPGDEETREVVLLETRLDPAYLKSLSLRKNLELVLFNKKGTPVVGTLDVSKLTNLPLGDGSLPLLNPAYKKISEPETLMKATYDGVDYQVVIIPVQVNYQAAGFLAVMELNETFIEKRNKLIGEAALFPMIILIILSITYLAIVRTITRPIKALEREARKLIQGKESGELDLTSNDEIGTLARTFQKMSAVLRQRQEEQHKSLKIYQSMSEQLHLLLESMTDGVVVINQDYEVEFMNKAAEKTFGEIAGRPCYKFLNQRESVCSPCSIEEIIKKGKSNFHYTTKTADERHFEVIGQPMTDIDGKVKILSLRRDITDRIKHFEHKQQNQQNLQEERLKTIHQLGVSIKHGISNALAALTFSLQLLKNAKGTPTAQDGEVFEMMEEEVNKIKGIVTKISNITEVVEVNYAEDITMIDLEASGKIKKIHKLH